MWHTVRLMMLAKQDRAPTAAQGSRYGCRCSSCPGPQYGTQLPHKWQGSASAPPIADPNTVPARNGTRGQNVLGDFFSRATSTHDLSARHGPRPQAQLSADSARAWPSPLKDSPMMVLSALQAEEVAVTVTHRRNGRGCKCQFCKGSGTPGDSVEKAANKPCGCCLLIVLRCAKPHDGQHADLCRWVDQSAPSASKTRSADKSQTESKTRSSTFLDSQCFRRPPPAAALCDR